MSEGERECVCVYERMLSHLLLVLWGQSSHILRGGGPTGWTPGGARGSATRGTGFRGSSEWTGTHGTTSISTSWRLHDTESK